MSWKAEYIILIMISTIIDYIAGLQIDKAKTQVKKKLFLGLSLVSNLGLLFAFKYFNFFSNSLRTILQQFSIHLDPITLKVLLPVGISFYTFQTLSYSIDIYRGKIRPQKHLGIFAVYVSFFPQLVAGPIERAKNLLPQFFEKHDFKYKRVTDGIKLMLWGFFKKIVIADRLSTIVNPIFNDPTGYSGLMLTVASFLFAFQIYCDFSGYSDIAIGSAQVMGFRLMDNFKRPYFSRTISEFWNRWHISLSSWFRDYVYNPLISGRLSRLKFYTGIVVVFTVSGLWHGANWTFVIWGLLHGIYLTVGAMTQKLRKKIAVFIGLTKIPRVHKVLKIITTFLLVVFGLIFFRANNIGDAFYIITHLFSGITVGRAMMEIGRLGRATIVVTFFSILFMEIVHMIQEHKSVREFMSGKSVYVRWTVYLVMVLSIVLFGVFENVEFIYFQF